MNLHAIVRGAISTVNPDRVIPYLASSGSTVAAGGKQSATFAASVNVGAQIQPVRSGDIKKYSYLQAQGVFRAVYLFGQVQGIDRVAARGGDLLKFPELPGGTVRTWLVKDVDEQWPDWCRVIVALQTDPSNPP